jgi:hypothetical protein
LLKSSVSMPAALVRRLNPKLILRDSRRDSRAVSKRGPSVGFNWL